MGKVALSFEMDTDTLDRLMPMHIIVSTSGHIRHVGPTMARLQPDKPLTGQRLLEVISVRRPRAVSSYEELSALVGQKLAVSLCDDKRAMLKGMASLLPGEGGILLNLSFGISVVDAVADYALTSADFAATDLAVEMLYLVEAKSAVLQESKNLNARLQGAKVAAEEQAFTDTLTGLKNRRAMDHVLGRLIAAHTGFALMHLDLDFFKDVNDTLGHAAGDHVLQAVAKVLVDETRDEDMVARVGGDEFVLIFYKMTDVARLEAASRRIIQKLEKPIAFQGQDCRISGSIGITTTDFYEVLEAVQMLADADTALYASKHRGRACYTVYEEGLQSLDLPGTSSS